MASDSAFGQGLDRASGYLFEVARTDKHIAGPVDRTADSCFGLNYRESCQRCFLCLSYPYQTGFDLHCWCFRIAEHCYGLGRYRSPKVQSY